MKYGDYNIEPAYPDNAYYITPEDYDGPEDKRAGHFFAKDEEEIVDEVCQHVQEIEEEEIIVCLSGDCTDEELQIEAVRHEFELQQNGESYYMDNDIVQVLARHYDNGNYKTRTLEKDGKVLCRTLSKTF